MDVRDIAAIFDVPLELIDDDFARELDEVRETHAHLPFANFMDMYPHGQA